MSAASYTYAVARPFDPTQAAGLVGVDGAAIHLVRHQDLVAVVSPLAPADADETALRARLETLAELEAIARAHHRSWRRSPRAHQRCRSASRPFTAATTALRSCCAGRNGASARRWIDWAAWRWG